MYNKVFIIKAVAVAAAAMLFLSIYKIQCYEERPFALVMPIENTTKLKVIKV